VCCFLCKTFSKIGSNAVSQAFRRTYLEHLHILSSDPRCRFNKQSQNEISFMHFLDACGSVPTLLHVLALTRSAYGELSVRSMLDLREQVCESDYAGDCRL
jgi:hypothetical protein